MNEVSNRFHRSGGCFTHLTTSPSIITSELILTWIYACMILIDNHSQVWCPLGPSHQHHPTKRRALSVWGGRWGLSWWPMVNYGWWRIIGVFLDVCLILEMWRWAQRRQNSKQLPKILWWQWYILQPQVPPSPYHMFWDLGQNSYIWYSNFEKVKCSILGPVLSLPGQKVSKCFMIRMILNQKRKEEQYFSWFPSAKLQKNV